MKLTQQDRAALLEGLRELCGYVENGTASAVSICQDDATKDWVVSVGKRRYFASSMVSALTEAIEDNTTIEERQDIIARSVA